MPAIIPIAPVTHPLLSGVRVFPISGPMKAGSPQTVLVDIEPNGAIPLHSHRVDATMTIVAGSGWVCSQDGTDGQRVLPGTCVFFESEQPHGFRAGPQGLSFVSVNGGIVDERAELWDLEGLPRA